MKTTGAQVCTFVGRTACIDAFRIGIGGQGTNFEGNG